MMSEVTDSQQSGDSASRKRCSSSPGRDEANGIPKKSSKVGDKSEDTPVTPESCQDSRSETNFKEGAVTEGNSGDSGESQTAEKAGEGSDSTTGSTAAAASSSPDNGIGKKSDKAQSASAAKATELKEGAAKAKAKPPTPRHHQSDSAAIAAAEALASLTGRDVDGETPCSSEKAPQVKPAYRFKQQGTQQSSRGSSKTQAAAADSSTSERGADTEDAGEMAGGNEGDESMSATSSTPSSSSFPSDNEDNDDGECAIVSVKMAPEMRQSVALLAQVQMKLEALEKKSARLHQRLEMKIGRQRRPHLDQRSSITKSIPGFWVTAVSFYRKRQ